MNEYRLLGYISRGFTVLFLGGVLYSLYTARTVDNVVIFENSSPMLFPALLTIVLVIVLAVDWISDFLAKKDHDAKFIMPGNKEEYSKVLIMFVAFLIYTLTLRKIGFIGGTLILVTFFTMLLNDGQEKMSIKAFLNRKAPGLSNLLKGVNEAQEIMMIKFFKAFTAAVLVNAFVYGVFYKIFRVMLP